MHTHACPDSLIERSRFPCAHIPPKGDKSATALDQNVEKRVDCRRLVVRVSSRSSRSLSHPRFFGLATHERERERKTTTTFSRFFYIAHLVQKSSCAIERRASSKSSRPTCFFSLERNDKRTPQNAICRRRACFRARADIGRWSKRLGPASKGTHFRHRSL